jgi:hypothetical protein
VCAYVIENDEAEGIIGLEIVEQGHHAVLGHVQLGLGVIYSESDTRDTRDTHATHRL